MAEESIENALIPIPLPTIRRMPGYLRILQEYQAEGKQWISTTDFSNRLSLKPIQVRKDMAYSGITGKPRLGFEVEELLPAIRRTLGWDNHSEAVLVGTGALGSALLGYKGFSEHGLKIVAAFDVNPAVIGKEIHGVKVLPMDSLESHIKRTGIPIGIITVPEQFGQQIADKMVHAGIKGIWNFSPVKLQVPPEIKVQKEDLSGGLAILSVMLQQDSSKK